MKKLLALLSAAVMCFSLVACGENSNTALVEEYKDRIAELEAELAERDAEIARLLAESENAGPENAVQDNTAPENSEPQYETVEITLDNWQEYFELKMSVCEMKNAFGELENLFPQMRFVLKENLAGITADMDIVFEYTCTDSYSCHFTYNTDTGELTEGEKTDDYVSDPWGTIREIGERHIEDGTSIFGNGNYDVTVDGNIASFTADMYSTVEILRIQGTITVINNAPQTPQNADNGETELLSYICGEWKPLYTQDEQILMTVSIFDNNTINIDENSFSWELSKADDNAARLHILENGNTVGYLAFSTSENSDISLRLIMGANSEVVLYKPSHYEIIPITLDNFDEYFEIRYFPHIQKNGFDEISQIQFYCAYVLKEEFYDRISQQMMDNVWGTKVIDNGAAELSFERGAIECKIDVENQTFEIVSFTPREAATSVRTLSFGGMWTPDTYGFDFASYSFTAGINLDLENGTGDNTYVGNNYELVRIEGTLYLVAEND